MVRYNNLTIFGLWTSVTMLILSRQFKSGSRLWVRAFTTTTTTTTRYNNGIRSSLVAVINSPPQLSQRLTYSSTSRSLLAVGAQVDEDLDTALDELLSKSFDDNNESKPKIQKKTPAVPFEIDDESEEHHIKDSKPVPPTLLVEVSKVSVLIDRAVRSPTKSPLSLTITVSS